MLNKKNKTPYKQIKFLLLCSPLIAAAALSHAGYEEEELARIAKVLKPISDSEWNELIGPKVSDEYEIQNGDNLWNISKSLFGNPFYWAKVWTFNNREIGNPHLIEPGQKLNFNAGSSMGGVPVLSKDGDAAFSQAATGEVTERSVKNAESAARAAKEYDKLSPEMWAIEEPPSLNSEFDNVGIDRDLRSDLDSKVNFRVPSLVNESTLPHLGEITASRRDGAYLAAGEVVFIKSNGRDLQVGTTYSVLSEPSAVSETASERTGYAYSAIAEVKIIGVKDSLYVAEITNGWDVVSRGDRIYPLLPLISGIAPKPARAPVEGIAVIDSSTSINNVSQHRFIFFDRGLEDGVEVGNVYRIYQYYDPITQQKITESDFLISADALVVHATAQFSTALITRGVSTVSKGDYGILLTDISDLERKNKKGIAKDLETEERKGDAELDELDRLDRKVGEGIGRQEELEVKELDQWDRTKDLEPAVPSDAKDSDDDLDSSALPDSAAPQTESMTPPALDPELDGDDGSSGEASGNDEALEPLDPALEDQGQTSGTNSDESEDNSLPDNAPLEDLPAESL